MSFLKELKNRSLIKQVVKEDELGVALEKPLTLFCGFDPTSDSLHVGSLLPLITLLRFKNAGHNPIALIGGATGLIGDPSFKAQERDVLFEDEVQKNVEGICAQIKSILNIDVVNNATWCKQMDMLTFLRDVGKHFTVNEMMRKESVKSRLDRDGSGISFTEFAYSLIQGLDFKHLFETKNCQLQIGGSDQFGNMVAGLELISKLNSEKDAFVITMPLVVKSDGTKFGKTESGTVWLDANKTSPFQFFQFWLNTADADIENFFKWFSLKSLSEIESILDESNQLLLSGAKPNAQQKLAEEMVLLVHGEKALKSVLKLQRAFFKNDFSNLDENDLLGLKNESEFAIINKDEALDFVGLLVKSGLASSKTEARRFINSKAVKINGRLVDSMNVDLNNLNRVFVLQRGKKNFAIVCLE